MRWLMLTAALAASNSFAADGLVVKSEIRKTMKLFGPPVHQESEGTDYYTTDKIRTEKANEEGYTILDYSGGKEIMYEVSPKSKTYRKIDLVELRKQAEEMKKKMEARLKQMRQNADPGNPLAALMGGMGQAAPSGPITVKKTSTTSRIAGYTATLIVFEQAGREALRVWHTDKLKIPTKAPPGSLYSTVGNPAKELIDKRIALGGFELGSRLDAGSVKVETKVTKVEKRNLPASLFEVPAGYKEAQSPAPGAMRAPPGQMRAVGH